MTNSVVSYSTDDLSLVAKKLVMASKSCKVIVFFGKLGAGKTTLIGNICHYLGVN